MNAGSRGKERNRLFIFGVSHTFDRTGEDEDGEDVDFEAHLLAYVEAYQQVLQVR